MQDARSLAAPVAVLRNPQAAGNQGGREQTPDYSSSTGFQHVLTRAEHETARSSPPQLLLTSSLSFFGFQEQTSNGGSSAPPGSLLSWSLPPVTALDWAPERVSPPLESLLNYRPKNLVDVGLKRVKVKVVQSCPTLCDPKELYSPGNAPRQVTGVGSCSLLQGIFPIQGSKPGLLHRRQILSQLSQQGSPKSAIYKSPPNTDS